MLTVVGARKGFENFDTGWGLGDVGVNVWREVEMWVESNSQYASHGVSFPQVADITYLIFNVTGINVF